MAANGELQQFRDKDRLMFKRDQIDTLAGGNGDSDSGSPHPRWYPAMIPTRSASLTLT